MSQRKITDIPIGQLYYSFGAVLSVPFSSDVFTSDGTVFIQTSTTMNKLRY